jgi:hypothetical protein
MAVPIAGDKQQRGRWEIKKRAPLDGPKEQSNENLCCSAFANRARRCGGPEPALAATIGSPKPVSEATVTPQDLI